MFNYNSKQRGGTLLGLILGLIVGLAIAVVVAVMIMKTPIPFTNKQARPERPAETGAVSDPNQPLYGKRDNAKSAPAPDAAGTPPAAAVAPAPAAPAVNNQSADQRAPVVENSLLDKPKKPDAKADNGQWIYYLQAGAFRSHDDAESTRAKLALLGFEAQVTERQSDQGTLYRVRLGPFTQLDAANRMRSKLADNGVDAAVVRTAK